MEKKNLFYHLHRLGNNDSVWEVDNVLDVSEDFVSSFYENILLREKILKEAKCEYDIDQIIGAVEIMENCKDVSSKYHRFSAVMNGFYILRRELALEEGRKIYNSSAPSRLHSIYLSDRESLYHWIQYVGGFSRLFEVEVDGKVFLSSDMLFPDIKAPFEEQVDESINYWQPKKLTKTSPKEYLVQGSIKIKGELQL